MTSLKAFDDGKISKPLIITLAALVLVGSGALAYFLQAGKSDGYDVDRRYTAKIQAFANTKTSGYQGKRIAEVIRFAEIRGVNGQKIFLQDPAEGFSNCEVGDVVDYRLDESDMTGNARFVYGQSSCREP
jgi:hypothetical protein